MGGYLVTSKIMFKELKLSGSLRIFLLSMMQMRMMKITMLESCDSSRFCTHDFFFLFCFLIPSELVSSPSTGQNVAGGGRYLKPSKVIKQYN